MTIATPYYLIDEQRMLPIMEKIRYVEQHSGAKSVLALKCFSSWCAFDFMKDYMAGTTSSSLYEAKLGHETFAGENHGYAVAYTKEEIKEVVTLCNKVIFNSINQLQGFKHYCKNASVGLRINPQVGFSDHPLSNTVCPHSRLGVTVDQLSANVISSIDGVMFHMNCDNHNYDDFDHQLSVIEETFKDTLKGLQWISLGGGVAFTANDYPLKKFTRRLNDFSRTFNVQLYLEPGEAAVTQSTSMVVTVLDIVNNGLPTLIVDAGVETHLLDVLTYDYSPAIENATTVDDVDSALKDNKNIYRICGRTCLSGDVFGHYIFDQPISIGTRITFSDVGGYSMVKKNFFNGITMPSICHKNIAGDTHVVRTFNYHDFKNYLS